MLGLPNGQVILVPWTSSWDEEYKGEAGHITSELAGLVLEIHHIGSTAVRHLSAKPIIDIAIVLNHFQDGLLCAPRLERLGYSYKGTNVLPGRHYFSKGDPRTHQIHMFQKGNEYLQKQLLFRDYLIRNEETRNEYQQLKERLASHFQTDKFAYSDAKTDFINTIMLRISKEGQGGT